jgi:hypothetical protein
MGWLAKEKMFFDQANGLVYKSPGHRPGYVVNLIAG